MSTFSRRQFLSTASAAAAAAGLAACGSGSGSGGSSGGSGRVSITVMGLPPKTQAEARALFLKKVAAFQKVNPTIKVTGTESKYDLTAYTSKLAGGTAETAFQIPFTDPQILIKRQQIADLTADLKKFRLDTSLNPDTLKLAQADGKTYGVPYQAYELGLIYNRQLFTKAGLDPEKPPATWDEVRAAAKAIRAKAGVPGFVEPTITNQGGWHLTAGTYSFGGEIEKADGSTYASAVTGGPSAEYLKLLQAMRWTDDSMGANMLRDQDAIGRDFAAGKVGMWIGASDYYRNAVINLGLDKEILGMGGMPQGGSSGGGVLAGGALWVIPARASADERAAALKWIDFMSLKPYRDPATAAANAKATAADKGAVGTPELSVLGPDAAKRYQDAIKPYVNVPLANFTAYSAAQTTLPLKAEPPIAGQEVYKILDSVMQAVLTKKGQDVDALLAAADKQITATLQRGQ